MSLNEDGEIERTILAGMDGTCTNEQIARTLLERYPRRYPRMAEALGEVGTVAQRFSRAH